MIEQIHRSSTPQLDFRNKNFKYETIPFSALIEQCSAENSGTPSDYLYLRSLGDDPRSDSQNVKYSYKCIFCCILYVTVRLSAYNCMCGVHICVPVRMFPMLFKGRNHVGTNSKCEILMFFWARSIRYFE